MINSWSLCRVHVPLSQPPHGHTFSECSFQVAEPHIASSQETTFDQPFSFQVTSDSSELKELGQVPRPQHPTASSQFLISYPRGDFPCVSRTHPLWPCLLFWHCTFHLQAFNSRSADLLRQTEPYITGRNWQTVPYVGHDGRLRVCWGLVCSRKKCTSRETTRRDEAKTLHHQMRLLSLVKYALRLACFVFRIILTPSFSRTKKKREVFLNILNVGMRVFCLLCHIQKRGVKGGLIQAEKYYLGNSQSG